MTRLNREDYRNAVGILKRYNYNCINIINIRSDIMSISIPGNDGMPKAPFNISDSVYNQYIRLQEDKELKKSLKEYKAVELTLQLVNDESKYIFEELYRKGTSKWQIINSGMSQRTYERRKKELIYEVDRQIKNIL